MESRPRRLLAPDGEARARGGLHAAEQLARRWLLRGARAGGGGAVQRAAPYVPDPESPTGKSGWPADGTALWTRGSVPTANFITGPTYLLNWGVPTTDKFDAELARREAMEFTRLLLELSSAPKAQLAL
jgi:hypothetical protein